MTHLTIAALVIGVYYGGLGWFLGGDVGLGLGCLIAATAFWIVAPSLSIPARGNEGPRGLAPDGLAAAPRPAAARARAYGLRATGERDGSKRGRIGQGASVANNG